jgi:hydrogenase maturation protease
MTLSSIRETESREPHATDRDKTLVVGLGNPILGDDGVGWRVAEEVLCRLESPDHNKSDRLDVVVERLSVGGLGLMERMVGFGKAIVIDSITTREGTPGDLSCFPLSALPDHSAGHTTSAHDTSLQNALKVAQEMGFNIPEEVWVVAIEARQTLDFSERLTAPVEATVPRAADAVLELLLNGAREADDHDLT